MSDTVTLSQEELDARIAEAVKVATASATPAATPETKDPEPSYTLYDVLRLLVHHTRLPQESQALNAMRAIDAHEAATTSDTPSEG